MADIFQALSQERPYRHTLGRHEVMERMDALSAAGSIDASLVNLLHREVEACYALAVAPSTRPEMPGD